MLGDIVKIVYFGEGSATDYCQIRSGGTVNTEATASDSKAKGADGTVGASIGVAGKDGALGRDGTVFVPASLLALSRGTLSIDL